MSRTALHRKEGSLDYTHYFRESMCATTKHGSSVCYLIRGEMVKRGDTPSYFSQTDRRENEPTEGISVSSSPPQIQL